MNLFQLPVGYILDPTISGLTYATIALTRYHDLPHEISSNTHNNHHIRTREYDNNCTFQTNWFDLAGTLCLISEPEPLNVFDSFEAIPAESLDEEPLAAGFWEQSAVPSPSNLVWPEAAMYSGCLEHDDPVFGNSCTKYWGAHAWFDCDP